ANAAIVIGRDFGEPPLVHVLVADLAPHCGLDLLLLRMTRVAWRLLRIGVHTVEREAGAPVVVEVDLVELALRRMAQLARLLPEQRRAVHVVMARRAIESPRRPTERELLIAELVRRRHRRLRVRRVARLGRKVALRAFDRLVLLLERIARVAIV